MKKRLLILFSTLLLAFLLLHITPHAAIRSNAASDLHLIAAVTAPIEQGWYEASVKDLSMNEEAYHMTYEPHDDALPQHNYKVKKVGILFFAQPVGYH
ncbi:hypothetical protein A374_17799 [Fictibacillus macauensis ZFHKF-1]|uniref:Uncharacterized protein n=1 Tax=Fictibacillus macauensis ZFHKF-1 TaxID=1196324 RepID=I8UAT1_9BACL|nr:hypothetical protein [Fictibacillus macauensis]EIT83913.1 hypothetical protein A374_17799 [Fictibacillus macauensis ZFHKF-1]